VHHRVHETGAIRDVIEVSATEATRFVLHTRMDTVATRPALEPFELFAPGQVEPEDAMITVHVDVEERDELVAVALAVESALPGAK